MSSGGEIRVSTYALLAPRAGSHAGCVQFLVALYGMSDKVACIA
jgi:hypothetical protein